LPAAPEGQASIALADCGGKLVVEAGEHGQINAELAAAGVDWIVRSGDCRLLLCDLSMALTCYRTHGLRATPDQPGMMPNFSSLLYVESGIIRQP